MPDGPDAGRVNVTATPGTGMPTSVTTACSGLANGMPGGAVWLPPSGTTAIACTVSCALAAGDVPACVTSVDVVLVSTPGAVADTLATIVQPPAGTRLPAGNVTSDAATVTPTQVPELPPVAVMPAGSASVKGCASVSAAALGLPSVIVITVASPCVTVDGANDLLTAPLTTVLVRAKVAGSATPLTVAVAFQAPAMALAVTTGETATPSASVVALAVRTPPGNVPDAPGAGNVKVTSTPATGTPPVPVTVADSGNAKSVMTGADCPPPPVAAIAVGSTWLVRLNGIAARPGAVAVTT